MPLISTRGAASAQGFGEFAQSAAVNYIEDVFSTYLYTGNGSTQTITNGIDLSGKGGLVWTKSRSVAKDHGMWDTVRGAGTSSASPNNKTISSNGANLSAFYSTDYLSSFNSTGFAVTYGDATYSVANQNSTTYTSWSFRKQAKFFDIQTWTGSGVAGKTITHNLGSVPGCIMVLCTTANYSWFVYHRSANAGGNTTSLQLNSTAAAVDDGNAGIQNLTSTTFQLGASGAYSTRLNDSGQTYIAYIFAHDAGGFGLSGTDNVISCGSYTGNGSATGPSVTLGWEPQWLLVKNATTAGREWFLMDNMRGFTANGTDAMLFPNNSNSESSQTKVGPTATGFQPLSASGDVNASGDTYIYIAIRRGPMKVPTSGTSVYQPSTYTGNDTGAREITGLSTNPDLMLNMMRDPSTSGSTPFGFTWFDRLRGRGNRLNSSNTSAAASLSPATEGPGFFSYFVDRTTGESNYSPATYISYLFRRAPGFFDVVCWTGVAGTAQQISHNLAAVPELIITKRRDAVSGWPIYNKTITATNYLILQDGRASAAGSTFWNNTEPTSSVFTAGQTVSPTGGTIVAYLFATVAGVSKVGSYTGSGTTKQIDCGFTAGARFVLIKRTDSTGDWYVYDSARGIVAGNDPYLFLNSTAAEVTSTDYVDTYSAGFELSSTAPAGLNANGGTYIFLAIA